MENAAYKGVLVMLLWVEGEIKKIVQQGRNCTAAFSDILCNLTLLVKLTASLEGE